MNRSRTLIKLASVVLATAGGVTFALAQQPPASAPNWNAPAAALPGATTMAPSNSAAPAGPKAEGKMVSPRGDTRSPYASPYRTQDTARAPAFPPDGGCAQVAAGGNVIRVTVPASTQGTDASGYSTLVVSTNVGKKAFVLDADTLPAFKAGRDVSFHAAITNCSISISRAAWPA